MVGDRKPHAKKAFRRQASWKSRFKNIANNGVDDDTRPTQVQTPRRHTVSLSSKAVTTTPPGAPIPHPRSHFRHSISTIVTNATRINPDEGAFADESSSSDGEDNIDGEEGKPISDRIRYVYPQAVPNPVKVPWSKSSIALQQVELAKQVESEDKVASLRRVEMLGTRDREDPIGTRLTMTSRSGFFNDRIINPSMVRVFILPSYGNSKLNTF
jgi:hypothetical protein